MSEFSHNLAVLIGIDSYSNGLSPLQTAVSDVKAIAAGWELSAALRQDGTVETWGAFSLGAGITNGDRIFADGYDGAVILDDNTIVALRAALPDGLTHAIDASYGSGLALAIRPDTSVVAWKNNANRHAPPPGITGIGLVEAGEVHGIAVVKPQPAP